MLLSKCFALILIENCGDVFVWLWSFGVTQLYCFWVSAGPGFISFDVRIASICKGYMSYLDCPNLQPVIE